jgi:hypothetical protein
VLNTLIACHDVQQCGTCCNRVASAQANESGSHSEELLRALHLARCYASTLVTSSNSSAALQMHILMQIDDMLHSVVAAEDAQQMARVFDRIVPTSLDSIESGAFTTTVSFLYQRITQSGMLLLSAHGCSVERGTVCHSTWYDFAPGKNLAVQETKRGAGQSACSSVSLLLHIYGSSMGLLGMVRRGLSEPEGQVRPCTR